MRKSVAATHAVPVNDEVRLSELETMPEIQRKLSKIFPTVGSFDWFRRTYREELVRERALYILGGRAFGHSERFERTALMIGERAARRTGSPS